MPNFDFLHLELELINDKIQGKAGGLLGPLVEMHVQRFLNVINGLKIIARRDDALVYNLYNPPQPTQAGMRALMRKLKETITGKVVPATANLAITHKCHCKCIHCSADPFINPDRKEVTTDEIKRVVDDALDLGASLVIFVGGEPLIHKDIFNLIDYVDKDKAQPMIFTNGFLLEQSAEKLAEAGLATLNISIDSSIPERHNEFRKVKGLYKKAFDGAKKCRDLGILTGISTYANHESLSDGTFEELLKIAEGEGFHEVTIFDCIPSGRFIKDPSVMLGMDEKKQVIELAMKYHEKDNHMGVVAQAVVNSELGVGCFGAYSQFYMTAYGDINPCDFNPISFGNIRDKSLKDIWYQMLAHRDFSYKHRTCRMQTPAYRKKYIDVLPDNPKLPVLIEDLEAIWAERGMTDSPT